LAVSEEKCIYSLVELNFDLLIIQQELFSCIEIRAVLQVEHFLVLSRGKTEGKVWMVVMATSM
jgi:hypothetical protein